MQRKEYGMMKIEMSKNTNLDERISNLRNKVIQNAITLRKKIKNGTLFKFKPFSIKQKKILTWWTDNSPVKDKNGIAADGSIRAGKTLTMSLSFSLWAMSKLAFFLKILPLVEKNYYVSKSFFLHKDLANF